MLNKKNIGLTIGSIVCVFLISFNVLPSLFLFILAFIIIFYSSVFLKNKLFIKERFIIKDNEEFFKTFNPQLTINQKIAAVTDNKKSLIISGAGTGKTSTIIAKILFLLKSQQCNEDEILLIVFTNPAGEELRERLEKEIAENKIVINTIHAYAKSIIKERRGQEPIVAQFIGSQSESQAHTNKIIKKLCESSIDFKENYVKFFQYYSDENIDIDESIESKQEYLEYLQANPLHTLISERVKSFGELSIANYLYSNGIDYIYEDIYRRGTSDSHKPDFHIKDSDVYIEYVGLDRKGNTRKDINKDEYKEKMKWKRKIHKKNETNLIEIFFYDIKEGTWQDKLKKNLLNNNIKFYPKSTDEIYNRLPKNSVNKYSKLIHRFLGLDKAKPERKKPSNDRQSQFMKLYDPIKEEYKKTLGSDIDFNDMINIARDYLNDNSYKHKFKYIIVDEFQDISMSDCNFIKSLLSASNVTTENISGNKTQLYCVGDDWQSIFAFRGAEPSIMRDFNNHFNVNSSDSTMVQLDKTFRFDNIINDISSKFLMKNQNQISKKLITDKKSDKPSVYLHWVKPVNIEDIVFEWVEKYSKNEDYKSKNLLILFGYNDYNPSKKLGTRIEKLWGNGRKVRYKTLHGSKGHEEDVVLIIGIEGFKKEAGRHSFPSGYKDDEVLSMVLDKYDDFPFSDERRLLYVGMTRAKFHLHMLCDFIDRSPFADELANYSNIQVIKPLSFEERECPVCKKGSIRKIGMSKYTLKPRYHCNRDPICNYIGFNCQQDGCGGLVIRGKHKSICNICKYEYKNCKECDAGILQKKVNKKTGKPFLSCHTFGPNTDCKYTEPIKK